VTKRNDANLVTAFIRTIFRRDCLPLIIFILVFFGSCFYLFFSVQPVSFAGELNSELIKDEVNRIINSDKGLNHFFTRLAMLENKQTDLVSVYHFGDSHVAAISLPNGVAEFLQLNFGFAGREAFKESIPNPKRKTRRRHKRRASLYELTAPSRLYAGTQDIAAPYNWDYNEIRENLMQETRGVKYYSYGYSGKSFNFFSKSEKMLNHIRDVNADLVIVTLGTNDVYGQNYSEDQIKKEIATVIGNIRRVNAICSILLITPPDSYVKRQTSNKNLPSVRNAIIESAMKDSVACWDFFSVMGGAGSMDQWVQEGLAASDKIHLTNTGYVRQAELLNYALMVEYQEFIKRYNSR